MYYVCYFVMHDEEIGVRRIYSLLIYEGLVIWTLKYSSGVDFGGGISEKSSVYFIQDVSLSLAIGQLCFLCLGGLPVRIS